MQLCLKINKVTQKRFYIIGIQKVDRYDAVVFFSDETKSSKIDACPQIKSGMNSGRFYRFK